jgi:diguanylate cyclase (GGDEF)-like protein
MRWSPSHSVEPNGVKLTASPDPGIDPLRRQFAEALRRAEIVSLVNEATGEEGLGRSFAEELCEVFDAEIGFVIAGGSPSVVPRLVAAVGLSRAQAKELLSDPTCTEAIGGSRAVHLGDRALHGVEARSVVLVPFRTRGGRTVLVGVARLYDQPFDAIETALLESVSESAGHALERIWAFEERDRRGAQQAALVRAAKSLNRSLEIEEILSALCEEVAGALEAEKAAAYLGSEADGYTVLGIAGLPESFRGLHRPAGEGLGAEAIREGRPMISHDFNGEGLVPENTSALDDLRVAIAVPLRWDDRIHGFLAAGFTGERRLGEAEVELVEGFAELAALACSNAERHAAVRESADSDQLTGCLNQGAFRRALRSRITIAESDEMPLSLVLLDLDGFKHVNDTAGHPAGDSVLREVGAIILAEVRDEDMVARYGGDEFGLILPGLAREGVEPVIGRIVEALGGIALPGEKTLSGCAGVASWQRGEDAQSLIDRADAALLEAKRGGRSSTVFNSAPAQNGASVASFLKAFDAPESRRRRRELGDRLQALAGRIGLKISREGELAEAARVTVNELSAALESTECVVARLGAAGEPEMLASFRRPGAAMAHGLEAARPDSAIALCLRKRRTVVDGGANSGNGPFRLPEEELAVPVFAGGELWGAIACRAEGGFGTEDSKLAELVADHLGMTMRAFELQKSLEKLRASRGS